MGIFGQVCVCAQRQMLFSGWERRWWPDRFAEKVYCLTDDNVAAMMKIKIRIRKGEYSKTVLKLKICLFFWINERLLAAYRGRISLLFLMGHFGSWPFITRNLISTRLLLRTKE